MTAKFGSYYHLPRSSPPMSADTPLALRRSALAAFLDAGTEQDAADALEGLLGEDALRHIGEVVRRELGGFAATHLEDVVGDVRLALMQRLLALRRGRGEAIDNFRAYITRASEHACYSFLRRRYPERSRFRNRVRYAAAHHPSISLERDASGTWRCSTRRPVRRAPEPGASVTFVDDPSAFLAARGVNPQAPLPALLDQVLAVLDRGIELDRLVDALAMVLGIKDAAVATARSAGDSDPIDTVPDPSPATGEVLEQREQLLRVWSEIASLPPRQRAALLLNLRDPEGGAVLHLLPATGVVTQADIAAVLDMSDAELAELWGRLPLEDRAIAESMGLTRQQVINLRKSARARLMRRVHGENS
jgi:RNA polymerase sigma factor (sigma-70 family)